MRIILILSCELSYLFESISYLFSDAFVLKKLENFDFKKFQKLFSDKLSQSSISCHGNILLDSTRWSNHWWVTKHLKKTEDVFHLLLIQNTRKKLLLFTIKTTLNRWLSEILVASKTWQCSDNSKNNAPFHPNYDNAPKSSFYRKCQDFEIVVPSKMTKPRNCCSHENDNTPKF